MKHRIFQRIATAVVVIPLFIVLTTTPAHAVFGSILAGIQRTMMIANQVTQIANDLVAKLTFDGQLTQMVQQATHLKEQALGAVGALTDPFTELASVPTQFIGLGLSWKNDFTGIAQDIASQRRAHGRQRQELSGIVENNGSPPLIPYPRRTFSICSRTRRSRRGLHAVISRRGKKATSVWCLVTP